MPRNWEVVLFVAAIMLTVFQLVRQAYRRRRPVRFQHAGATYERRRDGSFATDTGAPIAGAVAIGALAVAYQQHCEIHGGPDGSSGSDGGGSDGGGGDGGGDGGGGGGSD